MAALFFRESRAAAVTLGCWHCSRQIKTSARDSAQTEQDPVSRENKQLPNLGCRNDPSGTDLRVTLSVSPGRRGHFQPAFSSLQGSNQPPLALGWLQGTWRHWGLLPAGPCPIPIPIPIPSFLPSTAPWGLAVPSACPAGVWAHLKGVGEQN